METNTLTPDSSPSAGPRREPSPGFGPTPDPTRSGALWVGGAGVALLLAAAAVLTAVRWDDIGQSVKLGGLVAITLALLGAGQRFKDSIPMTAQAVFHLGALLIPFDMAAVAILAGRSWQETLLLTSVSSVVAWYAIERAVPSAVLKWCARAGVVVLAAGVAGVSAISMPLALAVAGVVGVATRKPTAAGMWALIAAVLPLASFVPWPSRIAGAMADLGFDSLAVSQPLAAGVLATVVLIAIARLTPRIEIAWSAVLAAVITTVVALTGFADSQINYVAIAALFVGVEMLALVTQRDPLWKRITSTTALVVEAGASLATIILLGVAVIEDGFNFDPTAATIGISGGLLALGWLTADLRRLTSTDDWLTALFVGSDWGPTTVMFPVAMLAAAVGFGAPSFAVALVALALAFWMTATWRTGGTYGALALVMVAAVEAAQTPGWTELGLGALGAIVLMVAAQTRVRAKDHVAAVLAALGSALVWLVASESVIISFDGQWPLVLVVVGAWALSWIAETERTTRPAHLIDWIGRLTAIVVVASTAWSDPVVGLVLCLGVATLAGFDYWREQATLGASDTDRSTIFAIIVGAAFGLAGVPVADLVGLAPATAGAALAVAGFVAAGLSLASPRIAELPLSAAAVVLSGVGMAMAVSDDAMFAFALIAVGSTAMFIAAAHRNLAVGIGGYAVVGVGVALELAALDVTWLEPYLVMPALAALAVGWRFHRSGGSSWVAFAPTIALFSYVALAERIGGGSAWHAVIAGTVGVAAVIGGGYRKLVGPLVTGSAVLAVVVGYESLGPAALVPTWAWLAAGGTVLLASGVAMERSDTTPLERGQQIRNVVATQFS